MTLPEATVSAVGERIAQAQRVLVVSHVRPDGDAVGSLLGLGLALEAAGKSVQMVLEDGVPSDFRYLSGSDRVVRKPEGTFDLRIVVDCSELSRTGAVFSADGRPEVNIDHHVTNVSFATWNIVVPTAAATTEVLVPCIRAWGLPLTQPVAEALLTGLLTDTLGFRTSSVHPGVLRLAAQLMEAGADLYTISQRALASRSFRAVRYWGCGLSRVQLDGPVVWTTLTLEDRRTANYPGRDDADLVNVLASVREAHVAVIFVEQKDGKVKVSWRAKPGVDVSQLAVQFGGGGHPAAAGAEIPGDLSAVQQSVLEATQRLCQFISGEEQGVFNEEG